MEGNEIITFYSRDAGKVRVIARSVKFTKSKLSFGLQQLFHSNIELVRSKKNFTLTGVKVIHTFAGIRSNLHKVNHALYAVELVLKSTADEQPNAALFDLFLEYLLYLDNTKQETTIALDIFTLKAMALLGYALTVGQCADCGNALENEESMFFSNKKSGFLCRSCGAKILDASRVNKSTYFGLRLALDKDFAELEQLPFSSAELHSLVYSFASYILERDLKTGKYI